MNTATAAKKQKLSTLEMILIAILAGCISGIGILVALTLGVQVWFAGRIFPGVSINGVDVGGMGPQAALTAINEGITYPSEGRILLKDGETSWLVSPMQMGLFLDPESSVKEAMRIGRSGGILNRLDTQWNTARNGRDIAPVFVLDERITFAQLGQIAAQVDKPVIEASLSLNGTEVIAQRGQIGRAVQYESTIAQIEVLVPTMRDGMVDLIVEDTPPAILDPSPYADKARQILSEPLTLKLEGDPVEGLGNSWQFDQAALAEMLEIKQKDAAFTFSLNPEKLNELLTGIAPELYRSPKDAKYTFNDETGELDIMEHAVIGRELDIEGTIQDAQSKLMNENAHQVPLAFIINEPQMTDETTGEDLGIIELVHEETSYFYGSSADRVQNISVAAAEFHGVLIPPQTTFSMAEVMKDITLDNGYAEALIISGGRTIKGVGGGVCQVSTTLFRAAFFAGFPIEERHSHAYRVSYYEKTAGNYRDPRLAGLDATVYIPIVDLKFTNDTDNWILMETYVNPTYSSIIWKFYGTKDNRTVEWNTTGPYNIQEPPEPKYVENSDLSEGEIKQVDWAAQGADVSVSRTVLMDGEIYFEDSFFTHYRPWQAVYEYGPGTELPNSDDDDED